MSCCETAQEREQQLNAVGNFLKKLDERVDKSYERWRYYDEPLSEHDLWEITQELKQITQLARTE
jgi:hypothetical protein